MTFRPGTPYRLTMSVLFVVSAGVTEGLSVRFRIIDRRHTLNAAVGHDVHPARNSTEKSPDNHNAWWETITASSGLPRRPWQRLASASGPRSSGRRASPGEFGTR